MVFVVERYLPGLSHSNLLRGLSRLEGLEVQAEGSAVRLLGWTMVLGDEACLLRVRRNSEASVAEANRTAGLSFDRIDPAVPVKPIKGEVR